MEPRLYWNILYINILVDGVVRRRVRPMKSCYNQTEERNFDLTNIWKSINRIWIFKLSILDLNLTNFLTYNSPDWSRAGGLNKHLRKVDCKIHKIAGWDLPVNLNEYLWGVQDFLTNFLKPITKNDKIWKRYFLSWEYSLFSWLSGTYPKWPPLVVCQYLRVD